MSIALQRLDQRPRRRSARGRRRPRSRPRARARGGAGADRRDRRPGQRPGVEARCRERLEQKPHPVGAGQADQGVIADPARHLPDLGGVEARHDSDRRQLDHVGAEHPQLGGQAARLGAGAGDDHPAAVQRAPLEPGERLTTADHRADDDQRRGADTLALDRLGKGPERRHDGPLPAHRAALDRGGGLVGVAAGVDQRPGVGGQAADAHVEDQGARGRRASASQSSAVSGFSGSSWPVTKATAEASSRWVTGIPA